MSSTEVQVAVYAPVSGAYRYSCGKSLCPGVRVVVPFGSRKLVGVVVSPESALPKSQVTPVKLKQVIQILDEAPVYSQKLLDLAQWLSSYYLFPLGEVLKAMLPASVEHVKKQTLHLTTLGTTEMQMESDAGLQLRLLFAKKKSFARVSFLKKLKAQNLTPATVDTWVRQGLLEQISESKVRSRGSDEIEQQYISQIESACVATVPPPLTPIQSRVYAELKKHLFGTEDARKPVLLHGVTGAGKTELYMHCLAELFEKEPEAQVLVLVPEISLTPQMTQVFTGRFPGQVAVVHSAMTQSTRWQQLERIRHNAAKILIGPRSSIFAPFANLKLVIVDEEHDLSYKQSSGLLYHARDAAIVRAKLEGAAVLLGSATPSLESYHNAISQKYHLVELLERVEGRPLPNIVTQEVKPGHRFGQRLQGSTFNPDDQLPINEKIVEALRTNKEQGNQSIVLVNRRGYSYYIFSRKDGEAIRCPNCAISLTLHKLSSEARCHYCEYKILLSEIIADRPDDELIAVGYGSEKIETILGDLIPSAKVVRLDSDVAGQKDELSRIINEFRENKIDILVGTQMLAKGHDFPKVTLIALLELDQCLSFPDFRSGEKTFQLIVQAAGRAGRADKAGEVMLQTANLHHPVVQFALNHDYRGFATAELKMRESLGYAPFVRMAMIEISSGQKRQLEDFSGLVHRWVDQFLAHAKTEDLNVLGPSIPPIEFIRKRYRRTIILSSTKSSLIKGMIQAFNERFAKAPKDMQIKIDIDPYHLI